MTEEQIGIYLNSLLLSGLEHSSARAAGVSMRQVQALYDSDEVFRENALSRIDEFNDSLEAEAIRRGKDGVKKPVFHKGDIVGHVTEYSDALLSKLLTGRRPTVYGNKQEISTNAPINIVIKDFDAADP